jgi:uncharacterized membrane protein affecting hemolysin expression
MNRAASIRSIAAAMLAVAGETVALRPRVTIDDTTHV